MCYMCICIYVCTCVYTHMYACGMCTHAYIKSIFTFPFVLSNAEGNEL